MWCPCWSSPFSGLLGCVQVNTVLSQLICKQGCRKGSFYVLNLCCASSMSLVQQHSSVFHSSVWDRIGASIANIPAAAWMFMQMPHRRCESLYNYRQRERNAQDKFLTLLFSDLSVSLCIEPVTVTTQRQGFWRHPTTEVSGAKTAGRHHLRTYTHQEPLRCTYIMWMQMQFVEVEHFSGGKKV